MPQNPAYFLRFLDILRSPEGAPLLDQLTASEDRLALLLPPPAAGVCGPPLALLDACAPVPLTGSIHLHGPSTGSQLCARFNYTVVSDIRVQDRAPA